MEEMLREADFIAAEDTRVSLKLLNHLDIKKPMVSYHRHNTETAGPAVLNRILAGETCALVTDAGMPAISDPGEDLVALCAANGVEVIAIPGPCALVTALAVSGLPTTRFTFEGFLPMNKKNRKAHLDSLAGEERTMIFYEAPHKLTDTLEDLCKSFGGERRISLCRELSKLHEEVIRTTLAEAVARYGENDPKGEFVLVVEGAAAVPEREVTMEEGLALIEQYQAGLDVLENESEALTDEDDSLKNDIVRMEAQITTLDDIIERHLPIVVGEKFESSDLGVIIPARKSGGESAPPASDASNGEDED
jgi:16S rRNA (cytidine1402-2'-O)-methyltransferase